MNTKLPEDDRETLAARLTLAVAYAKMLMRAYDALLYFGINYRDLPTAKDHTLIEEAEKLKLPEGRNKYLLWTERLSNNIEAAVRRKQFKLINKEPPKE